MSYDDDDVRLLRARIFASRIRFANLVAATQHSRAAAESVTGEVRAARRARWQRRYDTAFARHARELGDLWPLSD